MDAIQLTGLRAFGYHGVLPEETRDGQWFSVDVAMALDLAPAGRSDDLSRTVNYAEVATLVHRSITGEPCQLIETLAERIAASLLAEHPLIQRVDVSVHKPSAPIPVAFDDVVVTVCRERS